MTQFIHPQDEVEITKTDSGDLLIVSTDAHGNQNAIHIAAAYLDLFQVLLQKELAGA